MHCRSSQCSSPLCRRSSHCDYHFLSDDLEELKKLLVLLDSKDLTLYVTEQVLDEYARNRENKIADALGRLRDIKLNHQNPQLCQGYPEYQNLRELQKQMQAFYSDLLTKLDADIAAQTLKADQLLESLVAKASRITRVEEVVGQARRRMELGNPPGKAGSLGDAINWESLLAGVPDAQDIYIIADDGDWASALDRYQFKNFFYNEWTVRKKAIKKFATCGNFGATHVAVAKLAQIAEFTPVQANEIVGAALSNNQIG